RPAGRERAVAPALRRGTTRLDSDVNESAPPAIPAEPLEPDPERRRGGRAAAGPLGLADPARDLRRRDDRGGARIRPARQHGPGIYRLLPQDVLEDRPDCPVLRKRRHAEERHHPRLRPGQDVYYRQPGRRGPPDPRIVRIPR